MPDLTRDRFHHLGGNWSFWPPHSSDGSPNEISGVRSITHQILDVCLYQPGENLMHPDFGTAPDLFDPMSTTVVQYFVSSLRKEILKWVDGISSLRVDYQKFVDYENQLHVVITFIPSFEVSEHVLTFGYYEYQGVSLNQDISSFIESLTFDGTPFKELAT